MDDVHMPSINDFSPFPGITVTEMSSEDSLSLTFTVEGLDDDPMPKIEGLRSALLRTATFYDNALTEAQCTCGECDTDEDLDL